MTSEPTPEKRISISDAAEMIGVSVDTLRRWDKDGRLRSAGRTLGGWRYYLFTDMTQIIRDMSGQKSTEALGESDAMAYAVPQKTRSLSAAQRRMLKTRAEEIAMMAEDGSLIRINLLIADMDRILNG